MAVVEQMPEKLVLMYHSVASSDFSGVIGSFPISIERFSKQIQLLKRLDYKFKDVSELSTKTNPGEKHVFITSDDATNDWCKNALPLLEELDIPSHLGVIAGVWKKKPVYPLTHIIQIILATRPQSELKKLAVRLLKLISKSDIEFIKLHYYYEKDDVRKIIKGAANLVLPERLVTELIMPLTLKEKENLLVRFADLKSLKKFKSLTIGNHTCYHTTYGNSHDDYFSAEIEPWSTFFSKDKLTISSIFTLPIRARADSNLESLKSTLKLNGYSAMFTGSGVWDGKSFIIPRIDAKNFEETFVRWHF